MTQSSPKPVENQCSH